MQNASVATRMRIGGLMLVLALFVAACQPVQPVQPGSTVPAPTEEAANTEAPAEAGEVITLFIAPQRQACTGVAPMMCLRVRESADEDWQFFYSGIDGFFFVPGYNYELRVRAFPIANPPADGSSIGYALEEIVSMTPDFTGEPLPLVGTNWTLLSFGVEQMVVFDPARHAVTALFGDDGSLAGSAGCNRFTATYSVDGDILTIGPLATTRRMCPDDIMAVENAFVAGLAGDHQFTVNGDKLEIVYAAGQLIFQGE